MRVRTSAMIAGALGAGLTASIVLAQQIPGSSAGPRAGSGASGPSSSDPSLIYGASGTRGARQLLRNGLDYLQYQQYERALKFLRDAEAKEKDLSEAERQSLKRGIDEAQAGLRASSDATTPYALSDRARRRNGFTPAKPEAETAVASRPAPERAEAGTPVAHRDGAAAPPARRGMPVERAGREETPTEAVFGAMASRGVRPAPVEDAPGDPIRLTSAEEATPPSGPTAPAPAAGPAPDPQSARGEIPALAAPELPALTAVPSSPDAAAPAAPQGGPAAPATAPAGPAEVASTPVQAPAESAPAPAASDPAPRQADPAPAATANPNAPAPILLETPEAPVKPESPVTDSAPAGETPAGPGAPATEAPSSPAATPVESQAAATPAGASALAPAPALANDRLVAVAMTQPAAPGASRPASADETMAAKPAAEPSAAPGPASGASEVAPLPPLGGADASPAGATVGLPHSEGDAPAAGSGATTPDASAAPATADGPGPDVGDLPPLPSDLGRDRAPAPADPGATAPMADPGPSPARPAPIPDAATPSAPTSPSAEAPRVALGAQDDAGSTRSPSADDSLPPLPEEASPRPNAAAAEAAAPVATPVPATEGLPAGPSAGGAMPEQAPAPQPEAPAGTESSAAPAPTPAAGPPAVATAPGAGAGFADDRFVLPSQRDGKRTRLRPEQEQQITEAIARLEREEALRVEAQRTGRAQPEGADLPARGGSTSNLQTQTQYDIARAPSPAEARPIKAIPVPEDWVPLAPRNWTPQRKYWAAAATCHYTLYFQDPVLERYGHSVEQFFGPAGNWLAYPVDDPRQSTQRMQLLQPFVSVGLFAFQVGVWPYTAIMDPPWEAQYDLGYYRPGDMVPVDVYWLPLHGYGPPLHGSSY